MSKKIYARQVPPEYQESPLFIDGVMDTMEGIEFMGNRDYRDHTTPLFDHITAHLEDMCSDWNNARCEWELMDGHWMKFPVESDYTIAEALHDYGFNKTLANAEGGAWTEDELSAWETLFKDEDISEDDSKLRALEIFTGHKWATRTIRGCCQSDWQVVWYDTEEWTPDQLTTLETEYFNLGSEWVIHDEEEVPESPEDISGYGLYCTKGYNDDTLKAEIAAAVGGKPEDVVLYTFDRFIRIPQYRMA